MKNEHMILALYPNAYGMGYVLAESAQELVFYGVARIRPLTSRAHSNRFQKMIDLYEPSLVVLRDYNKHKRGISTRVRRVINALDLSAQKKGLQVHRYTREQIRDVFVQFNAKTKYQIAKSVCELIPELASKLPKERKYPDPEPWMIGMFDCVSVLLTHYYLSQ